MQADKQRLYIFFVTVLRFRHLGCHFLKPGDMSVSKILHFAEGAGPLKIEPLGLQKRSIMLELYGSLSACLSVFISILRHDFGKYVLCP
jgi:hypothetical protein